MNGKLRVSLGFVGIKPNDCVFRLVGKCQPIVTKKKIAMKIQVRHLLAISFERGELKNRT